MRHGCRVDTMKTGELLLVGGLGLLAIQQLSKQDSTRPTSGGGTTFIPIPQIGTQDTRTTPPTIIEVGRNLPTDSSMQSSFDIQSLLDTFKAASGQATLRQPVDLPGVLGGYTAQANALLSENAILIQLLANALAATPLPESAKLGETEIDLMPEKVPEASGVITSKHPDFRFGHEEHFRFALEPDEPTSSGIIGVVLDMLNLDDKSPRDESGEIPPENMVTDFNKIDLFPDMSELPIDDDVIDQVTSNLDPNSASKYPVSSFIGDVIGQVTSNLDPKDVIGGSIGALGAINNLEVSPESVKATGQQIGSIYVRQAVGTTLTGKQMLRPMPLAQEYKAINTAAKPVIKVASGAVTRVAPRLAASVVPKVLSRAVPGVGWGLLVIDLAADALRVTGVDVPEAIGLSSIATPFLGGNPIERYISGNLEQSTQSEREVEREVEETIGEYLHIP